MLFQNTLAVGDAIIKDIKKAILGVSVVVQALFLVLYGYSICTNLNHLSLLIPYIILTALSFASLIFNVTSYKKRKSGKVKTTKKVFKYCADLDKFAMLIIKIVEFAIFGGTALGVVLMVFSFISVLFKIVLIFVEKLVKSYYNKICVAINMDVEPIKPFFEPDKKGLAKAKIMEAVAKPFEKLANKISGVDNSVDKVELSKQEMQELEIKEEIKQLVECYKDEKEKLKEDRKAQFEEKHNERLQKAKTKLKQSLNTIFRKKNKEKN